MAEFSYLAGYFNSDISFPGLETSRPRLVTMYEMEFYFEEGFTNIDGEYHHIPPGTILSVCPGAVRYSRLPLRNYFIKVGPECEEFAAFIRSMPRFFASGMLDVARNAIEEILAGKAEGNLFRVNAGFNNIFAALEEERRRIRDPKHGARVEEAIYYMKANLQKPCTLSELARAVHLSPVYFHSLFKSATGETPLAYLTRLRIEKAEVMLLTGDLSPAEIAEMCGFSSETYFSAVFKKSTGCTPRQYRLGKMKAYWNGNK